MARHVQIFLSSTLRPQYTKQQPMKADSPTLASVTSSSMSRIFLLPRSACSDLSPPHPWVLLGWGSAPAAPSFPPHGASSGLFLPCHSISDEGGGRVFVVASKPSPSCTPVFPLTWTEPWCFSPPTPAPFRHQVQIPPKMSAICPPPPFHALIASSPLHSSSHPSVQAERGYSLLKAWV